MGDGLGDIAGAGLALGADHRRALVDAAQRLAEVRRAADKRGLKAPLVNVVGKVRRAKHLGLVDEVHADGLQHLRLNEVANARLGHDRDVHGLDDAVDHVRIGRAGNATLGADIRGHALERHDRTRAGLLGHLRLLRSHHVHDDAADELVSQPLLRANLDVLVCVLGHGIHLSAGRIRTGNSLPAPLATCTNLPRSPTSFGIFRAFNSLYG